MASREMRRQSQKKGEKKETVTQVEKNKEKHPLLYAGSIIVFAIIVVAFVGGGALSGGAGPSRTKLAFGKYAGKNVTYVFGDQGNYFTNAREQIGYNAQAQSQQYGFTIPDRTIWRQAYDNTVKHMAMLIEAKKEKYHISDKQLDDRLVQHPAYRGEDGKFDADRYNETSLTTRNAYKRLSREELLTQTYQVDALYTNTFSQNEVDFYANLITRERAFEFVAFDFNEYPEEKVKAYAAENLKSFKKISLSRILMSDYNKLDAQQVQSYYEADQKFEDLAAKYSRDEFTEKGGNMGTQYYYEIKNFFLPQNGEYELSEAQAEEYADIVFNLKEGAACAPIQLGKDWVIFKANAAVVEPDLEDADTLTKIRDYILDQKKGEVEDYTGELAGTFVAKAKEAGFSETATSEGYTLYETEYFPLNYLNLFQNKRIQVKGEESFNFANITSNREFFEVAFALNEGEISAPINLDNQIIVLKLSGEQVSEEVPDKDTYSYAVFGYLQGDFDEAIIDPEKHTDNFNKTYARLQPATAQ